jgi:hypothetical protein
VCFTAAEGKQSTKAQLNSYCMEQGLTSSCRSSRTQPAIGEAFSFAFEVLSLLNQSSKPQDLDKGTLCNAVVKLCLQPRSRRVNHTEKGKEAAQASHASPGQGTK